MLRGIGLTHAAYTSTVKLGLGEATTACMTRMAMGFSLLDHVAAMLNGVVYSKQLPFSSVLMDSWYATQKLMAQIDQIEKLYSCPLKTNRRVDDSGGTAPYVRVNELQKRALRTCSKASASRCAAFRASKKVKLFRVIVSSNRTEFVAPNDLLTQADTDVVQDVCGIRWQPIGVSRPYSSN